MILSKFSAQNCRRGTAVEYTFVQTYLVSLKIFLKIDVKFEFFDLNYLWFDTKHIQFGRYCIHGLQTPVYCGLNFIFEVVVGFVRYAVISEGIHQRSYSRRPVKTLSRISESVLSPLRTNLTYDTPCLSRIGCFHKLRIVVLAAQLFADKQLVEFWRNEESGDMTPLRASKKTFKIHLCLSASTNSDFDFINILKVRENTNL